MSDAPHIPVLLEPLLAEVAPISGHWLDGTFGAGGYSVGLLNAGADKVTGVDRDPLAIEMAAPLLAAWGEKLALVEGVFGDLDQHAGALLDGVVLDLGVSSMQLDIAERGFSFMRDGPLDMRMSQTGQSAADLVNEASEAFLADVLFQYGEERASRRIAKAIVASRALKPITTTAQLVGIIESCLPRSKPGHSHPATRSFQALRIAVNDEYGQLIEGLEAAERALKPGGKLAVVTFHSSEDRIVKRFFQDRAGRKSRGSRYAPEQVEETPVFEMIKTRAISADEEELARNPRARSAKLRVAKRTDAEATPKHRRGLGLPRLAMKE